MASRVITQLVSDLSGEEIAEGGGESIEFSIRGVNYSIDLTEQEAAEFDSAVARYIEHASRKPSSRRRAPAAGSSVAKSDAPAIREWASSQGIDVPARGRIPAEIRSQYEAAN